MFLTVAGVALAKHYEADQADQMGLGSREFHYLGQTLFNGATATVDLATQNDNNLYQGFAKLGVV